VLDARPNAGLLTGHKTSIKWIRKSDKYGGLYNIGFVQGPHKLKDEFGKDRSRFHCIKISTVLVALYDES
jgi:hypothetical protein